jgi:hypothetical protein
MTRKRESLLETKKNGRNWEQGNRWIGCVLHTVKKDLEDFVSIITMALWD